MAWQSEALSSYLFKAAVTTHSYISFKYWFAGECVDPNVTYVGLYLMEINQSSDIRCLVHCTRIKYINRFLI